MKIGSEGIHPIPEQDRYAKMQGTQGAKRTEQTGKSDNAKEWDANAMLTDAYILSAPVKGLYRPGKDAQGNSKIDYIAPKKDALPEAKADDKVSSDAKRSGLTTTDTDKVDREIEKLEEKKARIEQEIRTAEEERQKKLEQELRKVEAELAQKDNDNYRRQNAVVLDE